MKENGGDVALDNVVRLGLVLSDPEHPSSHTTSEGLKMRPTFRYYMTGLGRDFIWLVNRPPCARAYLETSS